MKKIIRTGTKRKPKSTPQETALTSNLKAKVQLIQALMPIGLTLKECIRYSNGIYDNRVFG